MDIYNDDYILRLPFERARREDVVVIIDIHVDYILATGTSNGTEQESLDKEK